MSSKKSGPEPLDQQYVTVKDEFGTPQMVPVLHPRWVEQVTFLPYQAPPDPASLREEERAGTLEEWLERVLLLEEDLRWLLQQTHSKFWCQTIFDESLHSCLNSYLQNAPRSYDPPLDIPKDMKQEQETLHRLFFMVFMRMATHKESKENFFTPKMFGDILYENFLFDVPKLMDLCVLYAGGNMAVLSKMIDNIFKQQPNYNNDLAEVGPTIFEVFDNIMQKCGLADESGSGPQKLSDRKAAPLESMGVGEVHDILLYMRDSAITLLVFLEAYPSGCKVFHQQNIVARICSFYESAVPALEILLMDRISQEIGKSWSDLDAVLSQARGMLVKLCHHIISTCCLQPILENSGSLEVVLNYVEDYLHVMSAVLSERRFLHDLDCLFSVQEDVDLIHQACDSVDSTRTDFILGAVDQAYQSFGKDKRARNGPNHAASCNGELKAGGMGRTQDDFQDEAALEGLEGACAFPQPSGVEMESLISAVRDLLPELGEGFILACLEEYGYKVEKVINDILEENLPPKLQKLDRSMKRPAEKKEETVETTLLSQRANVFAGDEFDVFSRDDIDMSKVFKGKREPKEVNTKKIMDEEKPDLSALKGQYFNYGTYEKVPEDELNGPMAAMHIVDDYDDEYDDTYDTNDVGEMDADSADEMIRENKAVEEYGREFVTPRVLAGNRGRKETVEESDEEEEEGGPKDKKDNFVQDPAALREKAAERAAYKAQRQGKKGQNRNQQDVLKGQSKGQGQTKETVHSRRQKEKNKSSRANHNRRAMADRKMARGMGPLT
ncbi:ASCC2 [Branchiostoma lanceolatum]|uniref:ASCC2 protein n=1 Tax=Branchiostoma lanceolatum TaxID=7740 RepID=A0A8K0EVV1_BRALA|nr:ASCC2 [Branchiostoma lanceolatum]